MMPCPGSQMQMIAMEKDNLDNLFGDALISVESVKMATQ